jgi:hypothetical protein
MVSKTTLPDWLAPKLWHAWLDARQAKFGVPTPTAIELALGELNDLVGQGWPAEMVLREAIARGTPRFYPPCKPGEEMAALKKIAERAQDRDGEGGLTIAVPQAETNPEFELRQEIQGLEEMILRNQGRAYNVSLMEQLNSRKARLAVMAR